MQFLSHFIINCEMWWRLKYRDVKNEEKKLIWICEQCTMSGQALLVKWDVGKHMAQLKETWIFINLYCDLKDLIRKGADLAARVKAELPNGPLETAPLMAAASNNHLQTVQVNFRYTRTPITKWTSLSCQHDHSFLAFWLMTFGHISRFSVQCSSVCDCNAFQYDMTIIGFLTAPAWARCPSGCKNAGWINSIDCRCWHRPLSHSTGEVYYQKNISAILSIWVSWFGPTEIQFQLCKAWNNYCALVAVPGWAWCSNEWRNGR